jgi:hypothetical protein
VDDDLVIHFVEAGDGADFDAIGEFTSLTFVRDNVCHKSIGFGVLSFGVVGIANAISEVWH